jgi:uncharacterized iron-regulated protein
MLFFTGCASLPANYVDLHDQTPLSLDAVLCKIADKQVIFVGEIHGTSSIHLLQLEVIKYLKQSGKEIIIALEAFPFTRQETFNKWIERSLNERAFEQIYRATWSVPYAYYKGIFDYAREQHIPLLAINAEDIMIREVSRQGLQMVPEDFLKKVNFSDCSTDAQYKEMLSTTYHASEFPFFCQGQRLRDAVMAFTIAQAIRGNNYTVVVLAGVAHSSKIAVPRLLGNYGEITYTVLLPVEVKYLTRGHIDKNIADFIWY